MEAKPIPIQILRPVALEIRHLYPLHKATTAGQAGQMVQLIVVLAAAVVLVQ